MPAKSPSLSELEVDVEYFSGRGGGSIVIVLNPPRPADAGTATYFFLCAVNYDLVLLQ